VVAAALAGALPGRAGELRSSEATRTPSAATPGALRADRSGDGTDSNDPVLAGLRTDLDAVLGSVRWRRATFGVLAVSLDSGDTLYSREPTQSLAPASNQKLFTTAAALHYLGPDYRWLTMLMSDAPLEQGRLRGDLILYGTGDPGISDRFYPSKGAVLDSLALQLRDAGVRIIEGRVLGDGTFFRGPERSDRWDPRDLNEWFTAASDALSYNENVVSLRVEPTVAGAPPTIHSLPDQGGIAVRNDALTVSGGASQRLALVRTDPTAPIVVEGQMNRGSREVWRQMTVQDPALFTAYAMVQALERAGIVVLGSPGVVTDGSVSLEGERRVFAAGGDSVARTRVLALHRSRPLSDYIEVVNQESHNLFADLILKTIGRSVEGEGSFEAGARAVERFLTRVVGVPEGDVHMFDGSGLAADNRATPAALVAVLSYMTTTAEWPVLRESLPEAGTRHLRRMQRTAAARNLRAKTGTIEGVSALSGIVQTAGGEQVVFSIVGNRLPSSWGAKRLEDRIGARLADVVRLPGGAAAAKSPPSAAASPPSSGR
jgi:D-alanyl-D-alanine carboxypeptidase/D-alanyl-D-alanine-endopeptidase (penicillin-binding protein 4)